MGKYGDSHENGMKIPLSEKYKRSIVNFQWPCNGKMFINIQFMNITSVGKFKNEIVGTF